MKYLIFTNLIVLLSSCASRPDVLVEKNLGHIKFYSNNDTNSLHNRSSSRDEQSAILKDLEEHVKSNPRDSKALLDLAEINSIRGDLTDAETRVKQALRINLKNLRAKVVLAGIYVKRGHNDMAEMILNRVEGDSSLKSRILNLKALIELQRNNNDAAMNLFKKSLKADTSNIAVRMNLGVQYLKYKQLNLAATQFERILNIIPEHKDAKMHMAIIHANRGSSEKAEEIFEEILSYNEKNTVAAFNLAYLLYKKNRFEDSIEYFKQYLQNAKNGDQNIDRAFAVLRDIKTKSSSDSFMDDTQFEALAEEINSKVESNVAVRPQVKPSKSLRPPVAQKDEVKSKKNYEQEMDALERELFN